MSITEKKILDKPFEELNDDEVFFKVVNAGYDNSEKPADIVAALGRILMPGSSIGYNYFHATTCGALLAARNNLISEAEYFIQNWGKGYPKYWSNYSLSYLMRDRTTVKFLLQGILAPVFKLTTEICKKETTEILNTFAKRIAEGRTLVYGNLSWHQLLDKISQLAIEQKTMTFTEATSQRKSLCYPPVKKKLIIAAEKRLNVMLPEDYKAFLSTSNGFECFVTTGVMLLPIEKVFFFKEVNEDLVDIWITAMDDVDSTFSEKLTNSILIGEYAEQQLLLVPLPQNTWECWHFSSWNPGEVVYPSFRFYMEEKLQQLEDGFYAH